MTSCIGSNETNRVGFDDNFETIKKINSIIQKDCNNDSVSLQISPQLDCREYNIKTYSGYFTKNKFDTLLNLADSFSIDIDGQNKSAIAYGYDAYVSIFNLKEREIKALLFCKGDPVKSETYRFLDKRFGIDNIEQVEPYWYKIEYVEFY